MERVGEKLIYLLFRIKFPSTSIDDCSVFTYPALDYKEKLLLI